MNPQVETALQTAAVLAPVLDPKTATVAALAPVALQMLQAATQLQQAGVLPPDQLAALFASIGSGIQATHNQWTAMNAKGAAQ